MIIQKWLTFHAHNSVRRQIFTANYLTNSIVLCTFTPIKLPLTMLKCIIFAIIIFKQMTNIGNFHMSIIHNQKIVYIYTLVIQKNKIYQC